MRHDVASPGWNVVLKLYSYIEMLDKLELGKVSHRLKTIYLQLTR